MENHRHLSITGQRSSLDQLIQRITDELPADWHRDRSREAEHARQWGASDDPMFCFVSPELESTPPAALWLAFRRDGELYVSTIVPCGGRNMSMTECNAVIEVFHDNLLRAKAAEAGLHVEFTPENQDPEDWMSSETAKRLRSFSGAANKSTGHAHPNDANRWFEFVIGAHLEDAEMRADQLLAWLVEQGWNTEKADSLALDYEYGRDLLKKFDQR